MRISSWLAKVWKTFKIQQEVINLELEPQHLATQLDVDAQIIHTGQKLMMWYCSLLLDIKHQTHEIYSCRSKKFTVTFTSVRF
jgi:hypothetical protein